MIDLFEPSATPLARQTFTALMVGDCRASMARLPANSIDAIVTDPPYELGFMGKGWDRTGIANDPAMWAEALRVLKPGGHLLAFSGSRTYHRMVCAIEDAGFDIRDQIMWLYGSGFPKSHDVSKAIDKAAGADREVIGPKITGDGHILNRKNGTNNFGTFKMAQDGIDMLTAPATDAARQWSGWGTALKPAHEDIVLARKPLALQGLCDILARALMEAICQLPSLASAAEKHSTLSQSVFGADLSGSAQWSAVLRCSTPADLFALMATLPFGSEIPSSLNTALSWLAILDEASALGSTSTTETASSLTTDLRTLNSLLSKITAGTITQVATRTSGTGSNASLVERIFNALAERLNLIQELSALGPVTSTDALADLRPNHSPIVMARKPLIGTVAANVLKHGTGALNVDGSRVGLSVGDDPRLGGNGSWTTSKAQSGDTVSLPRGTVESSPLGRWPANVIHDGSDEVVGAFPETKVAASGPNRGGMGYGGSEAGSRTAFGASEGSAARFFYCAKASKADRGEGNIHPTVKPRSLMAYLCKLVTPPGGVVLDPFMGSGSTGIGAAMGGFSFIGCEMEPDYIRIAHRRITNA